jgi:tRNA uridine 5-carboxymethylaminomethyl modification enzyme
MYVNGLSTSLPRDVQRAVVRSVPGLRRAVILRYGYAVEYDVVAPGQVAPTLESRVVSGLFLAGQVLGTSGYEEAAAQGLVAGVNAALACRRGEPFVVGREEGYIGVLVDDLVRRKHVEPYRMLTSRAEHRLVLGVDSARERLMEKGVGLGLVPEEVFHVEQARWLERRRVGETLKGMRLNPDAETVERVRRVAGVELRGPSTWARVLRRPDVDGCEAGRRLDVLGRLSPRERKLVVALLRYEGYVERSERERERVARLRGVRIPEDLDLAGTPGLSREVQEALRRERPQTIAEAERMPGVTPAALALLAGRVSRALKE